MKKTSLLFLMLLCLVKLPAFAQHKVIDSLYTALQTDKEDTNKVKHLNVIGWLRMYENPDSSIILGLQALSLSEKLKYTRGSAISHGQLGVYYYLKSDYPKALDYFLKALKLKEALGNKNEISKTLANIGNVYYSEADYPKALDHYLRALKLAEELGNKNGMAIDLANIGNIYYSLGDHTRALDYYEKGLKISEELGNKGGIAADLANIGVIYKLRGDFTKALDFHFKSLRLREELGNKNEIAITLENIGSCYTSLRQFNEAYDYLYKALGISANIGAKDNSAKNYEMLSILYETSVIPLRDTLGGKVLNPEGMRLRALYYFRKYLALRDTVFSEENKKQLVRKEMNYDFDKREAATKAEQDKKDTLTREELKQKELERNYFIFGFVLVALLLAFIFRGYRQKQKTNRIITEQKKLVDVKQKEILDSITYAKRLQEAIFPSDKEIKQYLPDSFLFYKPKDIIAGDFYWMEHLGSVTYIAAADSTGHGVPGAMVSVVCANALNRAVKEFGLRANGAILDKTRELVLETFSKSSQEVKDGMDISLLAIDTLNQRIFWSGANNQLWYISSNVMHEIKANKQSIGKTDEPAPFKTHEIIFKKGDIFYLLTDGYADQFGGRSGKKYKYKQLEEKLLANCDQDMEEQKLILEKEFEEWKGNLEQVDDVTIVGIKI